MWVGNWISVSISVPDGLNKYREAARRRSGQGEAEWATQSRAGDPRPEPSGEGLAPAAPETPLRAEDTTARRGCAQQQG